MVRPTEEQRIAVDKFRTGRPLKIAAFAGAGKTSTLKLLAQSTASRGLYLAFNKAIAAEARGKFPRTVDCRTTHAIAFRAVRPGFDSIAKMTAGLQPRQLAEMMQLKSRFLPGAMRLEPVPQAHLILGTVRRFCQSADTEIERHHVPIHGRLLGLGAGAQAGVQGWAVEQARILWARMTDRGDDLPLGHDGYLKLWALGRPKLAADYILLDEAQDTNAVVLGVLEAQEAQLVYVGDRHQQIYEWRGAVNAMEKIGDCEEATLTQSFRFGEGIAAAASRVLGTLGERQRLRGNPAVTSTIDGQGDTPVILARTNATVIREVLDAIAAGRKPCVVGGTKDLGRLLSDVYELKAGKPATSPELLGFAAWGEVVDYAASEEGEGVRAFVQLVEQHGESQLWTAVKNAQDDEQGADVILSTAHKAKGREWEAVRLAPDFVSTRLGPDPDAAAEVRLFYVAMTRARRSLIADSAMLKIFTTGAWKAQQPDSPSGRVPEGGTAPLPARPIRVKETAAAAVHGRRPEAAARDRAAPAARARHSGVAPDGVAHGSGGPEARAMPEAPRPRPAPPRAHDSKQRTLWGRIARLFGAS